MKDINKLELELKLTVEEINHVLFALQEIAAKIANPLSTKIREQAESQLPKEAQENS